MIQLDRAKLLRQLDSLRPGIEPRDTVPQSSSFIFKGGFAYTGNDETICRIKMDMPVEGAITAAPILGILAKTTQDKVKLEFADNGIIIKTKGGRTTLLIESEVLAPIDEYEYPTKWKKIPPGFTDAIANTARCVGKDSNQFITMCVHVHPEYMEAADNDQLCRYFIEIPGVKEDFLVRGTVLRPIVEMDAEKHCLTKDWWFFKNELGTIVGLRINRDNQFPNTDPFIHMKGEPIRLPQGLGDSIEKANVFSSEVTDNNRVGVRLRPGKIRIEGIGATGKHEEVRSTKYNGPNLAFRINPELLTFITDQHTNCEINDSVIKMTVDKFVYLSCLQEYTE